MKRMRALSYLVTGNPAHKPGGSLDDETPGVSGSQARKGKNRRPSTLPISVQSHLERDSSSSSSEDDAYGGLGKGMPSLKEGGSDSEEENLRSAEYEAILKEHDPQDDEVGKDNPEWHQIHLVPPAGLQRRLRRRLGLRLRLGLELRPRLGRGGRTHARVQVASPPCRPSVARYQQNAL